MAEHPYSMWIDGCQTPGTRTLDVRNPATAAVFAHAPDCGSAEVDTAVAAARRAFPAWSAKPLAERQRAVSTIAAIINENLQELTALFTREQGKPLSFAAMELQAAAWWCLGVASLAPESKLIEDTPERRIEQRRQPLGVVAAIIPWNFPILLAFQKIAPALVAGCTLIVKPSPYTPLTLLRIASLLGEIFPPGVINVVSGGDQLGPLLTSHPGIDKISFTGSTATGRKIMANAAADLKRLTLELGGNDPAIVMPDVDIAAVAPKLFWAAFVNSGQLCLATKRLYVHAKIYEPLTRAIVDYAKTIIVGDGARDDVALGPVQNETQFRRVQNLVEGARRDGLRFLFEGDAPGGPGYFVPVTIIDNPPDDAAVVTEEAFGPVLPIMKFDDIESVITRANASPYGLGASVWCRDIIRADEIAVRLDAGVVWINEIHHMSPFTVLAGRKQSGIGAENGQEGLHEFTAIKTVITSRNAMT